MKLLKEKECAAIILAAGNSSRMGRPKFTLALPNGTTFLENIINQYSDFGCREIVVVLNADGIELIEKKSLNISAQIKVVLNPHPGYGRFYSIKNSIKLVESNFIFIHNVDNPYAKKEVLDLLYDSKDKADFIKPVHNGKGGHPVLISKKICDHILQEKKNDINFKDILNEFLSHKVVVQDDMIHLNINAYDEYLEFYRK